MKDPSPFDLLDAPTPAFTAAAAAELAQEHFGVRANVQPLVSERDQNFRLRSAAGSAYVLKIANAAEARAVTDCQTEALLHLATHAPVLPVPRVMPTRSGETTAWVTAPTGSTHALRMLSWLDGVPLAELPDAAVPAHQLGAALARVGRGLRGFFHPGAAHTLLWDVRNALHLHRLLGHVNDAATRAAVESTLAGFATRVAPVLPTLRAQVIYNDLNPGNLLVDPADPGRVAGFIDFGDVVHSALVADVAVAAAYQLLGPGDPLQRAVDLVAGYHAVTPLEEDELDLVHDLMLARLCTTVCVSYWRASRFPDNRDYILRDNEGAAGALGWLAQRRRAAVGAAMRHGCGLPTRAGGSSGESGGSGASLLQRRRVAMGAGYRHFYQHPLTVIRGEGAWLYDDQGRRFLDVYNNVPHVGHCHPRVVAAVTRQTRLLSTHTRYLHDTVVAYAERLTALFPSPLNVCMFCCTGSEANELALRIAHANTGGTGLIVTRHAYHGNTGLLAALSGSDEAFEKPGQNIAVVPAPDTFRGPYRSGDPQAGAGYAAHIDAALECFAQNGVTASAFLADTIFSSAGIVTPPADYFTLAAARIRAAGGLFIADEVQPGFGRTGSHLWGFARHDVVPDIVTLGKPMGNGYPLAAVVTSMELAERFAWRSRYFNTFGGNPVACAAGSAVLDVLEEEQLMANAARVGQQLREGLFALQTRHPLIGDVRGAGLFLGAELVRDGGRGEPAGEEAAAVVEALRERGVLIGATGLHDNVLKLRPPMVFSPADATLLLDELDRALGGVGNSACRSGFSRD